MCRGVEQLVARRAHNPEVVGSSPTAPTVKEIGLIVEQREALFKRRGRGRGEDEHDYRAILRHSLCVCRRPQMGNADVPNDGRRLAMGAAGLADVGGYAAARPD